MKRTFLIMMLALACTLGYAQSTNPLNYSGRMYVEACEIIQTPRYVSYEDHAILSRIMRMPSLEVTKCEMDFEKGSIVIDKTAMNIKVNVTKKYNTEFGWVVVLYMDWTNEGRNAELVWPEYNKPYFQQIIQTDEDVKIIRAILSPKPYVASEGEALKEYLQGLGGM